MGKLVFPLPKLLHFAIIKIHSFQGLAKNEREKRKKRKKKKKERKKEKKKEKRKEKRNKKKNWLTFLMKVHQIPNFRD